MDLVHSSGKVNLTLRITGKLPSGYHELCSIFLRIDAIESLTIDRGMEDNVRVHFERASDMIQNRNILFKVLDVVRRAGESVPPLDMCLEKRVPPGTGLGCGSGNAAALLSWLARQGYGAWDCASAVGADVPFFCEGHKMALASGIGERIKPLDPSGLHLRGVIVIPAWRCMTAPAFQALDEYYGTAWPMNQAEAENEAFSVIETLRKGRRWGLLPNDFCGALMKRHAEYGALFDVFEDQRALAWGISGSGSSAFGIWDRADFPELPPHGPWIEDTLAFKM